MNTPRILDLKLGYNAYNEKKLHSQSKKYQESTCATEGFRFAGLKVFSFFLLVILIINKGHLNKSDEIIFRDKSWGFALKKEDLLQAFGLFFYDGIEFFKYISKIMLKANMF